MASQYRTNLSQLVGLLPLHLLLLPLEHLLGRILPLAPLGLPVDVLVATLLVDVVGGVDDVGQGLAGVLLLAVAEPQSTLAADLQ